MDEVIVKIRDDFVQFLKNELRDKMRASQTVQVKAEPLCNFEAEEGKNGNDDLLPIEKIEGNLDQTEIAVGFQWNAGELICDNVVKERLSPVPVIPATEGRDDATVGDSIGCSPTGAVMPSDFELPRCDKCGKMFARQSTLLTHLRTHDGDMPYQCDICQARFSDWSTELIPHLRMHGSSVNSYPCHICGEEYVSRTCLKKHLRSHEGVEVSDSDGDLFEAKHHRKFKCERCDCVFTSRKARLRHTREVHVLERRFTCNICQRSFFSKGQVASHIRWHSAERPYKCSSCSRTFQVKASLIGHQRIHTRECVYQCHICGIMFLHATGLRRHLRFHSQVKQFKCDVCERTFTLKTTLTKHIVKTHSHLYGLDKG